jgi:hypothetical protein
MHRTFFVTASHKDVLQGDAYVAREPYNRRNGDRGDLYVRDWQWLL